MELVFHFNEYLILYSFFHSSPAYNCSLACVIVNLSLESALQQMKFWKNCASDSCLNLLSFHLNVVHWTARVWPKRMESDEIHKTRP